MWDAGETLLTRTGWLRPLAQAVRSTTALTVASNCEHRTDVLLLFFFTFVDLQSDDRKVEDDSV